MNEENKENVQNKTLLTSIYILCVLQNKTLHNRCSFVVSHLSALAAEVKRFQEMK